MNKEFNTRLLWRVFSCAEVARAQTYGVQERSWSLFQPSTVISVLS